MRIIHWYRITNTDPCIASTQIRILTPRPAVREGFAAAAGVLMHYVLVSPDARRQAQSQMTYTVSVYVEDAGMPYTNTYIYIYIYIYIYYK
jgi:hypothetical protein